MRRRQAQRKEENMTQSRVAKWDVFEASFEGQPEGNPYLDVTFEATFSFGSREVKVP